MLNITKEQAISHIVNYGKTIAWTSDEPKTMFSIKYSIGEKWKIGEVDGIIVSTKYFEKAEKPYGVVTFELCGNILFMED
jgi:hypothetical protein